MSDAPRDLAAALRAITAPGYAPAATAAQILARRGAEARAESDRVERQRASRNAILALTIASLQMLAAMPLMAHGSRASPAMAGPAMHPLLRPALLVSTLVVIVIARSLFVRAWAALRRRTADMNILGALGSGTAFLYSAAATIAPSLFVADAQLPDVHFEAASFILAFVLVGSALEGRARPRTTAALALVEDARATRAPVQRLADRISAYFAPGIVLVATAAATLWAVLGPEPRLVHALTTFVTVVVVSCPCALGLATPTAIATAVGRAAQLGILVRSGDALERAARVDTVAIDETGTLTEGEPELVDLVVVNASAKAGADERDADERDADAILRMAAAVERGSGHPVGRAILAEAKALGIDVPEPQRVLASGGGARADVEGHDVRVGAIAWLESEGVVVAGSKAEAGFGIAVDGVLRAYGIVADRLHDDASDVVTRLKALGVNVVVLTGDREDIARAASAELGIDQVEAELSPEGKHAALDRLAREGRRVAVCGDGINDAPALARAHVGIAIGAGTDAALDASDITLLAGGLARLPDTLELARRSTSVIRQNLAWAFAYNVALVPIAAGALVPWFGFRMPPALASAAMALSSISVVLSSLRLRRFEPRASISREPPG